LPHFQTIYDTGYAENSKQWIQSKTASVQEVTIITLLLNTNQR